MLGTVEGFAQQQSSIGEAMQRGHERAPAVPVAMQCLMAQFNELTVNLDQLEKRLHGILAPRSESTIAGEKRDVAPATLAKTIELIADAVAHEAARVSNLIQRLEV